MHRRHLDATSPIIPVPRHRETGLPSKMNEDEDMRNMTVVKLIPNLVTRWEKIKGKLQNTRIDKCQHSQHSVLSQVRISRTRMRVGIIPNEADQSKLASGFVNFPVRIRRTYLTS